MPESLRLLSLLSAIEAAVLRVRPGPQGSRSVDYLKGVARLVPGDGGGRMVLQHFTLADGQSCVRVTFFRDAGTQEAISIYPQGDDFDWQRAASRVAEAWLGGVPVSAAGAGDGAPDREASPAGSLETVGEAAV